MCVSLGNFQRTRKERTRQWDLREAVLSWFLGRIIPTYGNHLEAYKKRYHETEDSCAAEEIISDDTMVLKRDTRLGTEDKDQEEKNAWKTFFHLV